MAVKVHTLIYKGADGEGGKYYTQLLSGKTPKHVLPDTNILLSLTDHTDCTDFLTRAIGVIREYNIRMVLPDNNIFICTYVLAVSTTRANSP